MDLSYPNHPIIYSAAAAIYSQTRLVFGNYLGFVVTEKATKSDRADVGRCRRVPKVLRVLGHISQISRLINSL